MPLGPSDTRRKPKRDAVWWTCSIAIWALELYLVVLLIVSVT